MLDVDWNTVAAIAAFYAFLLVLVALVFAADCAEGK